MITFAHIASILTATVVATSVGAGASAYALRNTVPPRVELETYRKLDVTRVASVAPPARLIIPSLNIDSTIEMAGRTQGGAMESPSNFRDVAWYKEGARPGEDGSAVIAGHLDNALGLSGVFKNLDMLTVGSYVYVETSSGEEMRFRVMRVAEYPYDEVPTRELFERDGGVYLNLITCAGEWLQKHKTYDHRLIVYTEYAPEGRSSGEFFSAER